MFLSNDESCLTLTYIFVNVSRSLRILYGKTVFFFLILLQPMTSRVDICNQLNDRWPLRFNIYNFSKTNQIIYKASMGLRNQSLSEGSGWLLCPYMAKRI